MMLLIAPPGRDTLSTHITQLFQRIELDHVAFESDRAGVVFCYAALERGPPILAAPIVLVALANAIIVVNSEV